MYIYTSFDLGENLIFHDKYINHNLLQLVNNDKYYHDLFYIGPIYHKKFLKLKRYADATH